MWQPHTSDGGYLIHPVGADHLNVSIRIQEGQVVDAVCNEPFALGALSPWEPFMARLGALTAYSPILWADSFLTRVFADSQSYNVCSEVRIL